jgi:hypothetical protein
MTTVAKLIKQLSKLTPPENGFLRDVWLQWLCVSTARKPAWLSIPAA